MIDVHLIGYTADLRHIVLDLEPDERRGRYRLEIDLDLFLTLDEVRERRRAAGMEAGPHIRVVDDVEGTSAAAGVEVSSPAEQDSIGDDKAESSHNHARPAPEVEPAGSETGREGSRADQWGPRTDSGTARADDPSSLGGGEPGASPVPDPTATQPLTAHVDSESEGKPTADATTPTSQPESRLTPAEIQALLRAGRSLRTVAKLAGIDIQRVERWLPPIVAERTQVIQEALTTPLGSDVGTARQPLVVAVTRNLSVRGIDPDNISWTANRRVDGRWTVQLRYRGDDRVRCASWSFDRRDRTLTAGSTLAHELGWSDDPGYEQHESAPPRPDGAPLLVEARLAEGAAPASGPPAGASGPPTSGPPAGASGPPGAARDGEAAHRDQYEQQESPGPDEESEAD
ncbi:MAG: septation protein SepH, partial [Actinomycetota bacterium]|nr:septation protein SepH [Actinomycetota bacterium]